MDLLDPICTAVMSVVLGVIIMRSARWIDGSERMVPMVCFVSALSVVLVDALYWLAYLWLKKESLYAFSASDISSAGLELLFPLVLVTALPRDDRRDLASWGISLAFTVANAGFWVMWAGDWFKNVLGAVPFWYLVHTTVRSLWRTESLSKVLWGLLGVLFLAIAACNVCALRNVWSQGQAFDTLCSLSWLVGGALLIVQTVRSLREDEGPYRPLALSMAGITWVYCMTYDSFEPWYSVGTLLLTALFVLLYVSLRRVVVRP